MTYKLTNSNSLEVRPHSFVAEASELRFPILIKDWPWTLKTSLGNGMDLRLKRAKYNKWTYKQDFGCLTLVVYND